MTSIFTLMIRQCGLNQRQASEVIGVSIDTIKSWCNGRVKIPAYAADRLHEYRQQISVRIEEIRAGPERYFNEHRHALHNDHITASALALFLLERE